MNYYQLSPAPASYGSSSLASFNPPWWIKITTISPKCLYFFGSFDSKSEAISVLPGYVEDLQSESATGIMIEITEEYPQQLTVFEE